MNYLQMSHLHYFIIWPLVAIACLGFGVISAGYKDVATSDARDEATITSIIKYVDKPSKAIKALESVGI